MPPDSAPTATAPTARLGGRVWAGLVILGLVGQLAWTVENMYLNVFIYDTITDNPTVLAVVVAASAITATVATLLIGAASDRVRRRRVFISVGYVLWGLSTAAFGLISVEGFEAVAPVADAVVITVVAIILMDCVMSFFGSGANDAAFDAWVTESTVPGNRGRVDSVLAIMPLLAMLIVFGALDGLTQAGEWKLFFGLIGLVVVAVGILSWFLVKDSDDIRPQPDSYLAAVVHGLRPSVIRNQPRLYLTLTAWAIIGTATQVFLPYLIIYIQRYLRIDGYAIVLGVVLISASIISVLGGRVIDRVGKLNALLPASALLVVGLVAMFFARGMIPVIIAGTLMMSGFMLSVAAVSATVRDFTPVDRVGSVQGLRMIFAIMIPMVVGPFVGAAVITSAAETYTDLGITKQVPTPWIFIAAAVVVLLAVLPVMRLRSLARVTERDAVVR